MTLIRETITWEQAVDWLRAQPDQAALVRACYFDDPLVDAARRFHEGPEWRAVRDFLPASCGTALDVGAGRGIASFALAADGWRVTALEPDPSRLVGAGAIQALASQAAVNITVVQEWGEKLPFEDGSFDLIHARQVLHHARDLEALCQELTRVLKPNGMLIATREHVIDKPEDLPVFLDSHPLHHLYGGENAYTLKRYLGALEGAGLRMRHVLSPWETPVNYFPMTELDVRRAVSKKLRFPFPAFLPAALICWVSKRLRSPGRLYSFVGVKL